jgi:hypothetical protein
MRTRTLRIVAAIGLATVLGAACGSSGSSKSSSDTTRMVQSAASVKGGPGSPGAELQSGLTALLQEHVYLAGIATGTALSGGDLNPPAQVLDGNSVKLADAIGSVYGKQAGDEFLALWRKHIGFFVDYTKARAANDMAGMDKAKSDLDGYREDFGAFISSANPNLPKQAVADELKPHIETLIAAIDAQAAKDPSQYEKLATAADHMSMTAKILATGIAKQFPEKFGS